MCKKGLFILFVFGLFSSFWAATVQSVLTNSMEEINLRKENVTLYIDSNNQLSVEEIRKKEFQVFEGKFVNTNLNQSYWLNFNLVTENINNLKWVLEVVDAHQELIEVYIYRKDSLIYQGRTGRNVFNSKEKYAHKNHVLDFPITPNDSLNCYVKFKSSLVGSLWVKLRSNSSFTSYALKEYYFLGIYYGALFLICLVNLILFLLLKEKIYIIYFIYVFAWILFSYVDDGLGSNFLWMDKPWVDELGFYFMKPVLLCSYVWYSVVFFKGKQVDQNSQRMIYLGLIVYAVLQSIEYFFSVNCFSTFFMFVPLVFIMHMSIKTYGNGYFPARFFILGNLFIFLGFFVRFLQDLNIIRFMSYNSIYGILSVYSRNIGVVLEVVTLTFAMGDRFRFLKKELEKQQVKLFEEYAEKQKLQTELISHLKENELLKDKVNLELENKVQERTKELISKSKELEVLNVKLSEQSAAINEMNRLLDLDNYRLKKEVKVVNSNRALSKDITYEDFKLLYPDKLSVFRFLDEYKWIDGYVCRKCNNTKFCDGNSKFAKRCTKCRYDESITAYTIFHKCKFPLEKAFYIVTKTVRLGSDMNVQIVSEELELRKNTVWNYKSKVIEAISYNKKHRHSENFINYVILNPE